MSAMARQTEITRAGLLQSSSYSPVERIDRLNTAQNQSALNRIIIQGPPNELQRFKSTSLMRTVCIGSAEHDFVLDATHATGLNSLDGEWWLILRHETENSLVFEGAGVEMSTADFISELAQRWPKLDFSLESSAYVELPKPPFRKKYKRGVKGYSLIRTVLKAI
jgi:hypothetical protein